ncbi:hypothetical protein Cni_G04856 [Canna indica]|uniref:ARM repeat superfamily protein n=1 Tax=Canna indica TaxID=4628 RepID=A0AAQ3JW26_9LILI|nr:hypothetical protein Cni_G04856 [Canna indica]
MQTFSSGLAPSSTRPRHRLWRREGAIARSLVTRLQIESSSSRIAVLGSLLDLLREDDKNVVVAAGQGVVQALVRLLDSVAGAVSCHEAREKAVVAIATISTLQSCRRLLAAEGPPLLHHLIHVGT